MTDGWAPTLGALPAEDGACTFRVWAPFAEAVVLHLLGEREERVDLTPAPRGYFEARVEDAPPGTRYRYDLGDGRGRPDPASRSQPEGVHGPSEVVDLGFPWEATGWSGLPLEEHVLYELHVGTFSQAGTFDGVRARLDDLVDLGVTAVELMPVAQFPGTRNWGYDGVFPYAVQTSYGGPRGLQALVDACHRRGLAVVLDVVYNHLGPEGNVLGAYGPYFSDRYRTPWGEAINFDGPHSDEVRRYFVENALHWVADFRVDGLRLDAVHGIFDQSPFPFLEELGVEVHRRAEDLGRAVHLMPETDQNDARLVRPREEGGVGLDAVWNEDFHHALHVLLTGEGHGYYRDYGSLEDLARAYRENFVYTGQRSAYRRRRHGVPADDLPPHRFVAFAQNHDQVGNRFRGERLAHLVSFEEAKLAAGAVLLSPFLPLLFMGEEYGEEAPFHYFVDHGDPDLLEAVRRGRQEEFAAFGWEAAPPDPGDEATFARCRLDPTLRAREPHAALLRFHRELLRLRQELPAFAAARDRRPEVAGPLADDVLAVRTGPPDGQVCLLLQFGDRPRRVQIPLPTGRWAKAVDSADEAWAGPGSDLPATLASEGEVELHIGPRRMALFSQEGSA